MKTPGVAIRLIAATISNQGRIPEDMGEGAQ
jgi:hypothetical protein